MKSYIYEMDPKISLAEEITMIALAIVFAGFAFSFFFGIIIIRAEQFYATVFKRPFYVHFYPVKKELPAKQQSYLRQHSSFYNKLSADQQSYFEHRMFCFINKYEFVGRNHFTVTEEVKIRVSACYVMLTFGMRRYLVDVFNKIIIYPEQYLSNITNQNHKGEFNPRMRAVVFSWADFIAGEDSKTDNINLGIHEFSHVLHFHGRKSQDVSAAIFSEMFSRILKEVNHPANRERLLDSGYFRDYAYENHFEFLAVIMEHYFETPAKFRQLFPELFNNISKMLNHKQR